MAKKTEEDYKESLKIKNNNSYALVRIQGGKAVLEDLYINDKSVNNNLQGKPKI
jgi:DNA-binding transcriptional regulator WhiA